MAGSDGQKSGEHGGACAATQKAGATGLLIPLYPPQGSPALGFMCAECGGVTRTQIGAIRHLWRKHRLKLQLTLFGGPLAACAENNSPPANAGREG